MQTLSQTRFWARIRGNCSRLLSVRSESILVNIALIVATEVRDLAADVEKLADYPGPDKCLKAGRLLQAAPGISAIRYSARRRPPRNATAQFAAMEKSTDAVATSARSVRAGIARLGLSALGACSCSVRPCNDACLHEVVCGIPMSVGTILVLSILLVIPAVFATLPFARTLPPGSDTCGGLAEIVWHGITQL